MVAIGPETRSARAAAYTSPGAERTGRLVLVGISIR
jgi:hypothetical protein